MKTVSRVWARMPGTRLLRASRIFGGQRHLDLLPPCIRGERQSWPQPFSLEPVLALRGEPVCVLASGDPMFFGVGASLARQLPSDEMLMLPAPSSCSLAAARMGWPLQEVVTLSVVARPVAALNAQLFSGVRLLVLSNDGQSPAAIAALLRERGFGPSRLTVLEHLGGTSRAAYRRHRQRLARPGDRRPEPDRHRLHRRGQYTTPVTAGRFAGFSVQARRPTDQTRRARHHACTPGPGARRTACGMSAQAAVRSASNGCAPTRVAVRWPSKPMKGASN